MIQERIYVLTSGNDEWVRLWEVALNNTVNGEDIEGSASVDRITIKKLSKAKTSVADVSSMAVLDSDSNAARVLLCGVGMEVMRLEMSPEEE